MFSLLRKTRPLTITAEDSILLLLDLLKRKGIRRVPESELHRLVFSIQTLLPGPMKFVHQPTTYSNELFESLKKLERNRLVDELVYVHDGWVPKHLYEVTRIGHSKALELEARVLTFRVFSLQKFSDSVIAAAKRRELLPTLHD